MSYLDKYSKSVKKLIRQYLGEAYESERHQELARLDQSFAEWREGRIDNEELNQRIHHYHNETDREMFNRYNDPFPDLVVANALSIGLLDPKEAPPELLAALADKIKDIQRHLREENER
jgi:hypothetical protein